MKPSITLPPWPQDAKQAISMQEELRRKISLNDDFGEIRVIAGVDVSYDINNNISRGFVVCLHADTLQPFCSVKAELPTTFPYIPGLLSFREIPVIIKALNMLDRTPDLLMVDGQGIAHPRRLGIAAHLGVLTGLPSIGVAKSRLVGSYKEPALDKGSQKPLTHKGEKIGTVLRSKDKLLPLFISPGNRVSHETAVRITLECLTKYRLPEPTRIADKLSKEKNQDSLFTV
ncbi:MAG TPA: deoxyribonuclease V [Rickettsiales bacterium]|nr:deoxyribonuclease V [Rickettsiales bacterium]